MTDTIQSYDPETGTVRELTRQQILEQFGQEEYDFLFGEIKIIDPADMTPEQRELQRRMDSEAHTNAVLAETDTDSLDDLPHESALDPAPADRPTR